MKNKKWYLCLFFLTSVFLILFPTSVQSVTTQGNIHYYSEESSSQLSSEETSEIQHSTSKDSVTSEEKLSTESKNNKTGLLAKLNDTVSIGLIAVGILLVVFAVYRIKKKT